MGWSVYQGFVVDSAGTVVQSATITVRDATTGALATIASDIGGTAKTNPFTISGGEIVRFYAGAGRYNVTAVSGTVSATFVDDLIGTAAGYDVGSAGGQVPTVTIGNGIWHPLTQNNYAGTGAPTITDDDSEGYVAGSLWVDVSVSPKEAHLCIDSTTGAAEWVLL